MAKRKSPNSYRHRSYRKDMHAEGLRSYTVALQQTDLHIASDIEMPERIRELVIGFRLQLENYIASNPVFLSSLTPVEAADTAPAIVKAMCSAAALAGVGPMAAVAGAISEFVGKSLLREGCEELVVENGGDVFLARKQDVTAAIYAGQSPLSNAVGVRIASGAMPCGICTSSGTIGHSLSFGEADSVTVLAESTLLADAVATRLGNAALQGMDDTVKVETMLAQSEEFEEIRGVVVICDTVLGARGEVELVSLTS